MRLETNVKALAGPRDFLAASGEMAELIRAFDWGASSLGAPEHWPQSLRTVVRIMLNTRHPMLIFWGPELIQFYNDAYRQTMGPERHPSALGQAGRECWSEIWPIIGPQIDMVMVGEGATWHEDQLVPVTRHGQREDVWWTYSYSPIDDAYGVGGVLVVCKDVTRDHQTREELRDREATWRAIFDNMHEGFALCEVVYGEDGVAQDFRYLEVNAAAERVIGVPQDRLVGKLANEAIPGIEPFWTATYAKVVETGQPAHFEYEVAPLNRWFEVLAYRTGPVRFAAMFLNITERKLAEARQTLLAREVDHRAKNALAVVQAALRLTKATNLHDYIRAVDGRVSALARAQTLLAEDRWTGADLHALLRGELEPFIGSDHGPQAELKGPVVALPAGAAQPLAMAVHELATNAVKHGALGVPDGKLAVGWRVALNADALPMLQLYWRETCGPAVSGPPDRRGFGSRVLDGTVCRQLGGSVSMTWPETGLVCELMVPLRPNLTLPTLLSPNMSPAI